MTGAFDLTQAVVLGLGLGAAVWIIYWVADHSGGSLFDLLSDCMNFGNLGLEASDVYFVLFICFLLGIVIAAALMIKPYITGV